MHRSAGFTLLELLTALTVVLILLSVALPGFQQQRQAAQLSEAASRLYSDIQQTRIEARRLGSDALNIYFFGDEQWCYRITDRRDVAFTQLHRRPATCRECTNELAKRWR